jgi:hypothetical protein
MTAQNVFPKIPGDVIYSSEVNRFDRTSSTISGNYVLASINDFTLPAGSYRQGIMLYVSAYQANNNGGTFKVVANGSVSLASVTATASNNQVPATVVTVAGSQAITFTGSSSAAPNDMTGFYFVFVKEGN